MSIIYFPVEKRRRERISVKNYYPVYFPIDGVQLGRLVNIHEEGLLILAEQSLVADEVYRISISLPKAIGAITELSLKVTCAWVQPAHTENSFWVGVVIVDANESTQYMLSQLLVELSHKS